MKYLGMLSDSWDVPFAQIDLKQAILYLKGGGVGESLEVKIGEGNLTFTEARNIDYMLNRGVLDDVREGDQVPVDVSFDFKWVYRKGPSSASTASGGTPTVDDVLKNEGAAANWTSSDTDTCRPYAVDVELVYTPDCSTGDIETITLADFRFESLNSDTSAGTVACSGKCNIRRITAVRTAQ